MTPSIRSPRFRTGVAAVSALVVLAGCGAESADTTNSGDADSTATATGAAALDLTDVRFDVRRDPG